jgi:hypothetical protein
MKVDEKITLKTIKTTLKPEMKLIVLATGLGLDSAPPAKGEAPITHKYDGISGNTQGDKKDSSPAPNAIKNDMFSAMYLPADDLIRQFFSYFYRQKYDFIVQ